MSDHYNNSDKSTKQVTDTASKMSKRAGLAIGKKIGRKALKVAKKAGKKIGKALMKALFSMIKVLLPYIGIALGVLFLASSAYYLLFETRGTEQKYTLTESNNTTLNDNGYFIADSSDLSSTNRAIKQFYQSISNKSYWQITDKNNIKLLEPTTGDKQIRDFYDRESQFYLNPSLLFSLDEYMYDGKYKYPEQFIKPVKYNQDTFELDSLTDSEHVLTAQSTTYNQANLATKDKETGIWDYGLGSIFKYKKDYLELKVEGNYVKKDIWNEDTQSVETVSITPESFSYVLDGYPEDIWLMTDAITFVGEYHWEYSIQKQKLRPLTNNETGEENSDTVKIKYGEYSHWVEEPCIKVDKKGKEYEDVCDVLKGTYDLYKYREGAVYQYVPAVSQEDSNEKGLNYLKDYLYNFKSYVPESVLLGTDFSTRIGTVINTTLDVGKNASVLNGNYSRTMMYYDIIEEYSTRYGVDPAMIVAIICQESGGRANVNADGLMQIHGHDGTYFSATNIITGQEEKVYISPETKANPELNIQMGVMYYVGRLKAYDGDALKALQSYNFDVRIIKTWYPEAWETLDWMNYREEVRSYYGFKELGVETRSASYDCATQWEKTTGKIYGDVCYVEHVLNYYNGNGGYSDLENHDKKTTFELIVGAFMNIISPKYDDKEPYYAYENNATSTDVEWILKMSKTMEDQTLFSERLGETLSFWEDDFITSFNSQGLSYGDLSSMIGNIEGYYPPVNMAKPPISSKFGQRIDPVTGRSAFHKGVDVAVPVGTPIYAITNGTIETVVNNKGNSTTGYGNYVLVKHDDGTQALYAHLSNVLVKVGDLVQGGQLIGSTGNTGKSTGPHLHFEFIVNGVNVDPLYIVQRPELYES